MARSTKAPTFRMNDIVQANWNEGPLTRDAEYRVVDISRADDGKTVRAYRLTSPSLREDVWIEGPAWRALSKSPHGLHEDIDTTPHTLLSVPLSDMKVGDVIVAYDPSGRTSYGMGGKGVFEILGKGKTNAKVLSQSQSRPGGPVHRSELTIPLHHIAEVKRVRYR